MSSLIYNSFLDDVVRGNIDCDTDTFYMLLVTSAYAENKDTHVKCSDVTNELAASGGYVAGGFACTVSVTKDTANDRVDVSLGQVNITSSTLTARKAVYYKRRGGAAAADELVAVNDFGADVSTTNGTFTVNASTVRLSNP